MRTSNTLHIESELFAGTDMLKGLSEWDAGMNDEGEFFVHMKFTDQETATWWAQILLGER